MLHLYITHVEEQNVDIILLTETKVHTKSAININGFQAFPAVRLLVLFT